MFFTLFWVLGLGGGGSPKGLVHNLLVQFFTPGSSKIEVFESNHLAEVVRSKPGRRIYGENATYPPFWAYSRTLPQGVELLV